MSTSDEPLWIKIRKCIRWSNSVNSCAAAVLRVIADDVVPEELVRLPGALPSQWVSQAEINQRQAIRQRLLAEAERAEAGR